VTSRISDSQNAGVLLFNPFPAISALAAGWVISSAIVRSGHAADREGTEKNIDLRHLTR